MANPQPIARHDRGMFPSTVITKVENLPALPSIIAELNELIADPEGSLDEIVRLISFDQGLTARILKVVNSAYYGLQRQISTIRHALIILGFDEIQQIVLGATVIDLFDAAGKMGPFDVWRFWEHSLACAFAAKGVAKILRYRTSGEVFVAGLLHDVGKIVLSQYFPEAFRRLLSEVMDNGVSPPQAEKEVLGMPHATLGHLLADHWNLPYSISEAIYHHHDPTRSTENPLMTAIIHLADFLAVQNGFPCGRPWFCEPTIEPGAWRTLKMKKLDLNETDLERFSLELKNSQEQIHEFLQKPARERPQIHG